MCKSCPLRKVVTKKVTSLCCRIPFSESCARQLLQYAIGKKNNSAQQPQHKICMSCGAELYLGKCINRNCDESRMGIQQSASANL